MKLVGIVSEYNPFHNGHAYQIEETRATVHGESAIVCVMSGDFVQRGEAACFSKHARAEAAVMSGADLVIELPVPWALSSAEGFARGAVGLLGGLNCINLLSFGSECGDINIINALATAIMDPAVIYATTEEMKSGISYASARQVALERKYGQIAKHLEAPNNILAAEYVKAINELHLRIEPMTIQRQGAGHDKPGGSASDVRLRLREGKSIRGLVPKEVKTILSREQKMGRGPVNMDILEDAIISRLRMLDERAYTNLPDAGEGLGNRLFAAAHEETTLDGIISATKTKRYAMSRIRRMCMCAALGITAEMSAGLPPYARVLSASDQGKAALRIITEKSRVPIITKPASVKNYAPECHDLFAIESAAHDLYVMGYKANAERRGGGDYRTSPFMR